MSPLLKRFIWSICSKRLEVFFWRLTRSFIEGEDIFLLLFSLKLFFFFWKELQKLLYFKRIEIKKFENKKVFISIWNFFLLFMGIEGLEPSRSKKSTDFHENLCLWTFSLSFIFSLFLICFLIYWKIALIKSLHLLFYLEFIS